jgi:hypothetical protein
MVAWCANTAPGNWTCSPPPANPGRRRQRAGQGPVQARVIALRRKGLSAYEISAHLTGEGTPLNRTSVAEILTEEGFGRLLRHPDPEASTSPDITVPWWDNRTLHYEFA